jgi:hypothetical protein
MFGWFQALMPKEGRFFELFVQHATIVVAGLSSSALEKPPEPPVVAIAAIGNSPF